MRIAVDVMGGDHGCEVVVDGVRQALERDSHIDRAYLVGREPEVARALEACGCRDSRLEIVHANDVLTMEDKPVEGLRRKKDSSIARAVELVKGGSADALISPGNTGGVVAASTIKLRPIAGVDRPAIATVIPAPENEFVLLDAGANVECRPNHIVHYAVMGNIFSREVLGYKSPRVGLLSVGTEDVKGNELTLGAFKLCKKLDLNFIGNVEGHDLFRNRVDVVVCDGFVGNIVLKTCESLAAVLFSWLRQELGKSVWRKAGAFMAKEAFRTVKRRVDSDTYGGAPLLGLNGSVFIAHGSANSRAIMNAMRLTANAVQHRVNDLIGREIALANDRVGSSDVSPASPAMA